MKVMVYFWRDFEDNLIRKSQIAELGSKYIHV